MKNAFIIALFTAVLSIGATVFSMDFAQARAQGIVGEKSDGYIGAVTAAPEATAIVNKINARRRAEYEKIAKNNGQPVSIVGQVASENIIKSLPQGSFYQLPNGTWKKK
jgi:uncharacterized protein YdbL (DUF1318 family)